MPDPNDMALRPEERVVFHGTHKNFSKFDDRHIGTGRDANSALGVHFAEMPGEAVDYGNKVLAVGVITENPSLDLDDYYKFFGYDADGKSVMRKGGFAKIRKELIAKGYDSLEYMDNEQTICVCLLPERIRILAELTLEEAKDLHDTLREMPDYDDAKRLAALKSLISSRSAAQIGIVRFDQVSGLGAVPFNQEIGYMGFIAMMSPSQYLALASARVPAGSAGPNFDYVKSQMEGGRPVGSPFLNVDFKGEVAKVMAHDGRTRMEVLLKAQGDVAIPVHIFPSGGARAKDMTEEMIAKFRDLAIQERESVESPGPHFAGAILLGKELSAETPSMAPGR